MELQKRNITRKNKTTEATLAKAMGHPARIAIIQ
jgi:hypothetical protein